MSNIDLFAICSIVLLCVLTNANARDRGQFGNSTPEMKAWFDGLKSGKGACCSDADGTALSNVDWDTKDHHYRVRIEGEWYDVAPNAVLDGPNKAGVTMAWPLRTNGRVYDIRCFLPGSMT